MSTVRCQYCGSLNHEAVEQEFGDGSKHMRLNCLECRRFIKYQTKENKSVREEMFDLVLSLSSADAGQFLHHKLKAQAIMRRINNKGA